MASSSYLLPSELMLTLSDEWLHPSQCGPRYTLTSSTVQRGASSDICSSPHQQLDHLDTWDLHSCFSSIPHRSYREETLTEVPDLSHTPFSPFSCDSNLSSSASLPLDPLSDLGSACYAPDMDALHSMSFDPCVSHCHPHELSLPSFPCTGMESTIHSPMPVFAYKTFNFDYDCPPSPAVKPSPHTEHIGLSHHKRDREDENTYEDGLFPKRRKMSSGAPGLLPLHPPFPDPSRDLPSGWNPCNPMDTSYPDEDTFSMEKLLNCSFDWSDAAWPKLPGH